MIKKLMEMQNELDTNIDSAKGIGEPMLSERILSLLTEIGELTNEWRRFKFWSEDREPRNNVFTHVKIDNLTGEMGKRFQDKVLEEYVDGLHFVLGVGNKLFVQSDLIFFPANEYGFEDEYESVLHQFHLLYSMISPYGVGVDLPPYNWESVISEYLNLGIKLGYSLEQIEKAYMAKNEVNYKRQKEGY